MLIGVSGQTVMDDASGIPGEGRVGLCSFVYRVLTSESYPGSCVYPLLSQNFPLFARMIRYVSIVGFRELVAEFGLVWP